MDIYPVAEVVDEQCGGDVIAGHIAVTLLRKSFVLASILY